jgi:hypothetical protein
LKVRGDRLVVVLDGLDALREVFDQLALLAAGLGDTVEDLGELGLLRIL